VQRAILIYSVMCIPVGLLWYFSENIFELVISSPEVARLAGLYVRLLLILLFSLPSTLNYAHRGNQNRMMIPGLWFSFLFETLKRWLQAQSIVNPIMYVSVIAVPICVGFEFFNLYVLKLGFQGMSLLELILR